MTEQEIPAVELRAGDQLWTRTWYGPGMQPKEVCGWRKVSGVTVGKSHVTITMVDDLDPGVKDKELRRGAQVTWRLKTDRVQVRRPR